MPVAAGAAKIGQLLAPAAPAAIDSINKGVNFSQTAAQRMNEAGRAVPVQTLIDTIRYGACMPDPRGSQALMYYGQLVIDKSTYVDEVLIQKGVYTLEVLYDTASNTIWHFMYY